MTEHHAHEPNEFFATYRPTTSVMHEAREAFSTWLEDAAPGSGLGEEMAVVLSELLANAFAASLDDDSTVAVRAWLDHDLTLEVTNPAHAAFDVGSHWDYDDPLRPGGRGLMIVESLVDDLAITPPHDGTPLRVRCQRALSQRTP
jgi:anti-sigma regulatory factor (Ser/Thr protein kinase)